ncbi:hypothetical protein FCU94_06295 [Vibrio sp. JPW-9-11-11]|uniref:hypothetical protein n=1 Tax=Vibrio sp. JPW-9-11-11 TaxID=1416532 RepID=UPI0015930907|nr:hypothetical protein [Vibrio sp. JPW-9-11-11]NVD06519.1 hypothetical protein [Vibrio sp. JPW-9-11-11]
MNDDTYVKFNVDEQLKQIEAFTEKQQQDVAKLIDDSHSLYSEEVESSTDEIQAQVSGMMSDIEIQLEQEIGKINEQLQNLLPTQTQ